MASPAQFLEQMSAARQGQRFQKSEEQRVAQRNAQAAVLEQALQNPNTSPEDRHALLTQHAALFQPQEAPDLFQRLAGLIHGQQSQPAAEVATATQQAPAETAQPMAPPAPVLRDPLGVPYSDPQQAAAAQAPVHPFQTDHPVLNRFREGLDALQGHLRGFAQPVATPPVNPAADDVLARTYRSQAGIQKDAAQLAAQNALNLEAERRKRYLLTATPENKFLNQGASDAGYNSFAEAPPEVQTDLLKKYKVANVGPKLTTAIVIDPDSSTGYSKVSSNQFTGEVTSTIPGITPPRGFVPTQRATRSTDQYGNITTSVTSTTPQVPGLNGAPVSSKAPKAPVNVIVPPNPNVRPGAAQSAAQAAGEQAAQGGLDEVNAQIQANKGKAGAPSRKVAAAKAAPVSSAAPSLSSKTLDANGQIPADGANSQVREFAQQLIDDRDVDKIPAKARAAAASLAREYGWSQGKFTPAEQGRMLTANKFLDSLASSRGLSVLDNPTSRLKIASVLEQHPSGMLGQGAQILSAMNLSPEEQQFINDYNAALGTVQGLTSITRSGRPIEAAVTRLKAELPNVLKSANSADAKNKIQLLQREVQLGLEKNSLKGFGTSQSATSTSSTPPPRPGYTLRDGPKGYGYYKDGVR